MLKNCFSDVLLVPKGTAVEAECITLEVRLPWYRSLPLSVVEVASVRIDGVELALAGASLEINGQRFALETLADQVDQAWFMLDSAWLRLPNPGIASGHPHEVELLLKLYPPYIPALTWVTWGTAAIAA